MEKDVEVQVALEIAAREGELRREAPRCAFRREGLEQPLPVLEVSIHRRHAHARDLGYPRPTSDLYGFLPSFAYFKGRMGFRGSPGSHPVGPTSSI